MIPDPKFLTKSLFTAIDPSVTTSIDVPLGVLAECARHQLVITCSPDPAVAGSVKVRGIGYQSGLAPAHFDSRLDAIDMTKGSQILVFYGLFTALRFDFASFGAGTKLSAHLVSHVDALPPSGNTP